MEEQLRNDSGAELDADNSTMSDEQIMGSESGGDELSLIIDARSQDEIASADTPGTYVCISIARMYSSTDQPPTQVSHNDFLEQGQQLFDIMLAEQSVCAVLSVAGSLVCA